MHNIHKKWTAQWKTQCSTCRIKCKNPPIVFTRIRSPRVKSTSTRIRSHFLNDDDDDDDDDDACAHSADTIRYDDDDTKDSSPGILLPDMESLLQEGYNVNWRSTETSHKTSYWYEGILSYNDRLKQLGLEQLEGRRMRSDLIETFKTVNRKYDINPELFFQLDGDRRGHDHQVFKKRFRLNVRKYAFSNRVIGNWNLLSANCVNWSTINTFRKHLSSKLESEAVKFKVSQLW